MNTIKIRGLEIMANVGVGNGERSEKQPLVFDVDVECDFFKCVETDDINDAINYSEVCDTVAKTVERQAYALLETVAYECASAILELYPATEIELAVYKPQAPIKHKFSNVGVSVKLKRERVFLSLGSNLGDRKAALDYAISRLERTRGVKVKKTSKFFETEAYGGVTDKPFINCAVEIETYLSPFELLNRIHRIESGAGRVRDVRWGDRTLDIDIIFFGRQVIYDEALRVPHIDYKNRAFVLEPLMDIAPDAVCPECGLSVRAIYKDLKKN